MATEVLPPVDVTKGMRGHRGSQPRLRLPPLGSTGNYSTRSFSLVGRLLRIDLEFIRTEVARGALGARDALVVDGDSVLLGARVDGPTAALQVNVRGSHKLRGGAARLCLPSSLLVGGEGPIGHTVPLPPGRRRGVVVEVAVERLRQRLGRPDDVGLRDILDDVPAKSKPRHTRGP